MEIEVFHHTAHIGGSAVPYHQPGFACSQSAAPPVEGFLHLIAI